MSEDNKAEDVATEEIEDEEISTQDTEEAQEQQETDEPGDTKDQEEQDKPEADSEEMEVVREIKGSQPSKKTKSFSNRINKLKGQTQQETNRADGAEDKVKILEEQVKLQNIALDTARNEPKAPVRPNPKDFDEGAEDVEFIKKQDEFYDYRADLRTDKKIAELNQTQTARVDQNTEDQELDRALTAYMQKADETCPKDHVDKEAVAVEVLGNKTVNDIIKNWDDAPLIIHYLGTNKDEAENLRDLLQKNPVKGVAKIERLLTEISFKPKNYKSTVPEPDEELPGGSASAGGGGKKGPKFW